MALIDELDFEDLCKEMFLGTKILIKATHQTGSLTGKTFEQIGRCGACDCQRYIEDNSSWLVRPYLELRSEGAVFGVKIISQETGELLRELGPRVITGRGESSDIAKTFREFCEVSLRRIAKWVSRKFVE